MFGRVAGASLRALAVVGLAATAVAVVDVVDPGEVPAAEASVVDGFTPNVPCDFSFNFWGVTTRIANNDVYDRDALAWFPTQPLYTTLDVGGRGVLENDQVDSWTLGPAPSNSEVAVASPPRFAQSFTMNTDGTFVYVPQPGYYGADSFTYVFHTNNGPCSNIGTVTILPVKRVRAIDDEYTTSVDTPLEVGKFVCGFTCGVIDNDVFPDTSRSVRLNTGIDQVFPFFVQIPPITVPDIDGVTFPTLNGTVSGLQRNGSFVYTPKPGFQGIDRFYYSTSTLGAGRQVLSTSLGGYLGNGQTYATVTITVGPPPADTGPRGVADEFSTNEDTPLQITSAQLRANDPSLNYVTSVGQMFFQGQTPIQTANGRLDVSWISLVPGNPLSPQYVFAMTYTPNANFEGVDRFSYAGRLGIPGDLSADIPVSIRVLGTDDPPAPQHDTATTDEDVPITIDAAANDRDPDGDLVRNSLAEDPCTVNMCAPAGWLNERHGTWVVNGNGTITYTPERDYVGPATFLYEISDERGAKGYARVTVDVRSNNAMDDRYTTPEDTELVVAAPGVLANDEGEATSAEVVTPPSGTLTLNPDGSFRYRPLPNAYGTDSFTYRAGGDLALVVIDVTPVSDPVSLMLNSGCVGSEPTDTFVAVCLASFDDRDVNEGETAYVRGRIVDVDNTPGTLVVNWGDGSPTQSFSYPCTGSACALEIDNAQCWAGLMCQSEPLYFTLTHTYADDPPGDEPFYRVSVTSAEQQTGLFNTQQAGVRVRNTDVVPGAPTAVVPTVSGGGRLSVAFTPPASDGGAPISLYRVVCSSPGRASRSASGAASPLVVTGLVAGASYTCRAIAQNEIGWSPSSAPSSPVVVQGVPGVPTGVTATVAGSARLSVAFTPPVSDGGSPITSYRAVCSSPTGIARSAVGGSSPLLVTGLEVGASYSCVVAALNVVGSSGPSSASAPVTALAAPASPTGVVATPTTTGRFSVSFIEPELDGGSPITSYRVVCSSSTGTARSASGAASPIVITSLTVGANYTCRASATNAVGTSAPSPVSATTVAR